MNELLIGEFARRCRLPVSTLRYYDRIGLLAPGSVDPVSGYRQYRVDQLPTAVMIHRLRSIGSSPAEIARIVAGGRDGMIALGGERDRLAGEIEERTAAMRILDDMLVPAAQVHARPVDLAPRMVAALSFSVSHDDLSSGVLRAIVRLRSLLRRGGERPISSWGATLPLDLDDRVHGHVHARVTGQARPCGWEPLSLPTGSAIEATAHPDTLWLAYEAVLNAASEHGVRPTGPVLESYPSLSGGLTEPTVVLTVPVR